MTQRNMLALPARTPCKPRTIRKKLFNNKAACPVLAHMQRGMAHKQKNFLTYIDHRLTPFTCAVIFESLLGPHPRTRTETGDCKSGLLDRWEIHTVKIASKLVCKCPNAILFKYLVPRAILPTWWEYSFSCLL